MLTDVAKELKICKREGMLNRGNHEKKRPFGLFFLVSILFRTKGFRSRILDFSGKPRCPLLRVLCIRRYLCNIGIRHFVHRHRIPVLPDRVYESRKLNDFFLLCHHSCYRIRHREIFELHTYLSHS